MNATISAFTNNFNEKIFNLFSDNNTLLDFYATCTNFIKRKRKISASNILSTLIISNLRNKPTTLVEMSSILSSIDPSACLDPESIRERINSDECVNFLKKVVEDVFRQKVLNVIQPHSELLKCFKRVLIEDSSKWELSNALESFYKGFGGKGSKSYIKINIIYDWCSGRFVSLSEHSGTKFDQTIGKESLNLFEPGDLILRDLGYLNMESLEKIHKRGAYYLSRISGSTTVRYVLPRSIYE